MFFSWFLFFINCEIILQSSARHWKPGLYSPKAKEKWLTDTQQHSVTLSAGFLWTLARLSIDTVVQHKGRFILVWFISYSLPKTQQKAKMLPNNTRGHC